MKENDLVEALKKNRDSGKVVSDVLETDDRVLARITDGIYRQPSSALRELIANAYDADAENVYIHTDWPRFNQISVRDDGNGMTLESLARLIHHIGGSSKRTEEGSDVGTTNAKDPTLSPKRRRLIGKIGIGLFSVSQLTRHFQIITKTAGEAYRLVAEVELRTYAEDSISSAQNSGNPRVKTGMVRIKSVPASDRAAHGTEIILLDLRPQTREFLQSQKLWQLISASEDTDTADDIEPPKYHIGRFTPGTDSIGVSANLPWRKEDEPNTRFASLFDAILEEVGAGEKPKLETILDNYLRMLWTLSLSAPLNYIGKHPFDLTATDEPKLFELTGDKGTAKAIELKQSEKVRTSIGLGAPERGAKTPFRVFVDGTELLRPIRFSGLLKTAHAIKTPLLFVGKAKPNLSAIAPEERGGDLEFEAYFLWAPKVVPAEHNGLLVRIGDASGTLFDETFMKYQVSELTRLRQITAEVFVRKGLDAALNIDRESFNFAHPHYQYLMKWVHRALRQLANTHKQIAAAIRLDRRDSERAQHAKGLRRLVRDEFKKVSRDEGDNPSEVVFSEAGENEARSKRKAGTLVYDSNVIFAHAGEIGGSRKAEQRQMLEDKVRAVAQLLETYGAFDRMSHTRQQELLRAIVAVFVSEGEENAARK